MDPRAIRERLRSLAGTGRRVRVTRGVPSEPHLNGFVLALGRAWVLIRQFHDFYPEGCTALRWGDITAVRSGAHERLWERMLAGEGLLDPVGAGRGVPLDDTSGMLRALRRRGQNVILECEDPTEAREDFYIGRILSVGPRSVRFANFDALGRWDPAPHSIPFVHITKVQLDTPYARTFSRYLRQADPPRFSPPARTRRRASGPRRRRTSRARARGARAPRTAGARAARRRRP